MKHISLAAVVLSLAANAAAEECVTSTESYEGKPVTFETCVALVDDVIKASDDGYVQINYIVHYKGQRLLVSDSLAKYDYAVGDHVSFMVMKHAMPADERSRGFRLLDATVYPLKPAGQEQR